MKKRGRESQGGYVREEVSRKHFDNSENAADRKTKRESYTKYKYMSENITAKEGK